MWPEHHIGELWACEVRPVLLQCNGGEPPQFVVIEYVQWLGIGGIHPIRTLPWKSGGRQRVTGFRVMARG